MSCVPSSAGRLPLAMMPLRVMPLREKEGCRIFWCTWKRDASDRTHQTPEGCTLLVNMLDKNNYISVYLFRLNFTFLKLFVLDFVIFLFNKVI